MSQKRHLFPKQIYLTREIDQNDEKASWFSAAENVDAVEHEQAVGIYQLVETKIMKITRDLQ